jgi:hypothetical protein
MQWFDPQSLSVKMEHILGKASLEEAVALNSPRARRWL